MKLLLGFVAGALVAAGVAWFVVSRNKPAEPAPVAQAVQAPTPVAAPPAQAPEQPAAPAKTGWAKATTSKARKPSPAAAAPVAETPQPAPAAAPVVQPAQPAPQPVETAAAPPPPAPAPSPAPEPPPPPKPHTVTLIAGTLLPVRLGEALSSDKNQQGDTFTATLDRQLVIDGFVVAERGARVEGRVVDADRAGRVKGVSNLSIELVRLTTADGQRIALRTEPFRKEGQGERGRDAAKIGAAAGIGAAIGAIAGGGRGAAIGAGVGGAAGTGGVLGTRGKAAELPVETRISFRVNEPVTITEKLQ
jgi:hypothetical protein